MGALHCHQDYPRPLTRVGEKTMYKVFKSVMGTDGDAAIRSMGGWRGCRNMRGE